MKRFEWIFTFSNCCFYRTHSFVWKTKHSTKYKNNEWKFQRKNNMYFVYTVTHTHIHNIYFVNIERNNRSWRFIYKRKLNKHIVHSNILIDVMVCIIIHTSMYEMFVLGVLFIIYAIYPKSQYTLYLFSWIFLHTRTSSIAVLRSWYKVKAFNWNTLASRNV